MQEDVRGLEPWAARHTPFPKLDYALSGFGLPGQGEPG